MKNILSVIIIPGGGMDLSQARVNAAHDEGLLHKNDICIFTGGGLVTNKHDAEVSEANIMFAYAKETLKMDDKKHLMLVDELARDSYENMRKSMELLINYLTATVSVENIGGMYDDIVITIASDPMHLLRFKTSAKYIVSEMWHYNVHIELRFVPLNVTRPRKDWLLEKIFYAIHQFDPYGVGVLASLNRLMRTDNRHQKKESRYVDLPRELQNKLALLSRIYGESRGNNPIIEFRYSRLEEYDYKYSLPAGEFILNLSWSLAGDVRIVNLLTASEKRIKQNTDKIIKGSYSDKELMRVADWLYRYKGKQWFSGKNMAKGIENIFKACTAEVELCGVKMTPYILLKKGESWYEVFQYDTSTGAFVRIKPGTYTTKVVAVQEKVPA